MKKNSFSNSIRFRSWSYFMLFALSILFLLQIFQLILIEPFYKNTLKRNVERITNNVAELYFDESIEDDKTNRLYSLTTMNNACVVILNKETSNSTTYDALGYSGCAIYANSEVNPKYIEMMDESNNDILILDSERIDISGEEVMIVGKKFTFEDSLYYILSNVRLSPIESITNTIQNQFIIISLIVFILAALVSAIFSQFLSKPIMQLNKEATKLTYGNYDVNFEPIEINEIQQLADTIETAANEISKVDEYRKELIANVSHDLKTPLTMIKAYSEMIKDISGDIKEKREEHLDIIISETDSLSKLVNDMLEMSKLQAGSIPIKMEPFDLSSAVSDTVERFSTIAESENVTFELQCEAELVAIGDLSRINEVLYNFVSNALKHYGQDKKIYVNAYLKDKGTIRVEVIDHGSGIDEEALPYIWDRYFKVDKSYQRSKTGTGLGLAISKAILDGHKAVYGVESKINEGSMFYFELEALDMEEL